MDARHGRATEKWSTEQKLLTGETEAGLLN